MINSNINKKCVDTIRILSADIVEKAKSGHPGAPIGLAPAAHILWSQHLSINPTNPNWTNRDRFILSNGHSSALQYVMLHLSNFDLKMKDLEHFRQLNSKTPGHPEFGVTPGVECTTGPLGQGIAQAVGMAIAEKHAAAKYNKPGFDIVNHKVYVFCGDGCLQEGISHEALSLAGHLKLDNLVLLYDDNNITIDGNTELSFTEDVSKRLRAYGWNTLSIENGNTDFKSITESLKEAKKTKNKPTFISCKTLIGYKTTKENTHGVHGAPLGKESIIQFKEDLGFDSNKSFSVSSEVYKFYKENVYEKGIKSNKKWKNLFTSYKQKYPELANEFIRIFIQKILPKNWKLNLPVYTHETKADATRNISGKILNSIAPCINELIGGSADLTPSNKTQLNCSVDFQSETPIGRYIRFGVREHGMFAIGNGLSSYGYIPFTATFLNFITYGWGAVRLSALSHLQQIYIMTHDSIFLGEDGPTHQPIEVLPLLRATPNLLAIRPCDGKEVSGAWINAIENRKGPTVICLTRQNLPNLKNTIVEKVNCGIYKLFGTDSSSIILISSGSEVNLCVKVASLFKIKDIEITVLSAPCIDLFEKQSETYKSKLLPKNKIIISVEAAATTGWGKYARYYIGIDQFGESANFSQISDFFGFTAEKIKKIITNLL